jgi:hypothetical protein
MQGPNVKRLITIRMATIAVPEGTGDPMGHALRTLLSRDALTDVARQATEWVQMALYVARTAPDNPWTTDEEIAGEILRRYDERESARRK